MAGKSFVALVILGAILLGACSPLHPGETTSSTITSDLIPRGSSVAGTPDQPIWFITPTNGSSVTASVNSSGATFVDVQVQVNVPGVSFISLDANGTDNLSITNSNGATSFTAQFSWQPSKGNGSYKLIALAFGAQKDILGTATIDVTVFGSTALAATPTEVVAPPASVVEQLKLLYLQDFQLSIPFPAIAHKNRSGVTTDPWVSTAWLGQSLYQIYLYPDGRVDAYANPVQGEVTITPSGEKILPVCTSKGVYRMLVVFIDYKNLGITTSAVLGDLQQATGQVNAAYNTYGGILQIQTKGVVIPVPGNLPADGQLTRDMIKPLTGLTSTDYDWITQVDLDADNTTRLKGGNMEQTSFGYATGTCGGDPNILDIWVAVDNENELTGPDGRLLAVLLSHEVFHLFGYPASHFWACGVGKTADPTDQCDYRNIPALMLGWTDTDGDGTAEILDTGSPYGMKNP